MRNRDAAPGKAPADRADALRDGVLIDVTASAREAGIRWPVALTCAAWERCVRVNRQPPLPRAGHSGEAGSWHIEGNMKI